MHARSLHCYASDNEHATEEIALKYACCDIYILLCRYCCVVVLFANECYMYTRNHLGIERAKKMIAICTNSRQHVGDDSAVSLAVIDDII